MILDKHRRTEFALQLIDDGHTYADVDEVRPMTPSVTRALTDPR